MGSVTRQKQCLPFSAPQQQTYSGCGMRETKLFRMTEEYVAVVVEESVAVVVEGLSPTYLLLKGS